jgi:tryptophan 2,3-dioxygenase
MDYGSYLHLEELLACQQPESAKYGPPAHDEMLFIITHQAYELWFKQAIHELESVQREFSAPTLPEAKFGTVIHRLQRVREIQALWLMQIDVMETMTPLDFLEFRDLLVPASGFQSMQFKRLETLLGVQRVQRTAADQDFVRSRLSPEQQRQLATWEAEPSLLDLTDRWLARMPFLEFGDFKFWQHYGAAVEEMLLNDRRIIEYNPAISETQRVAQLAGNRATQERFSAILNAERFETLRTQGEFRFSHRAFLAALFTHLYREQPMFHLPFRYLTLLVEVDEGMTQWRMRHLLMVQRMLGRKVGTGGSAGSGYLQETMMHNRVFQDLYAISTFLLPRSALPQLPPQLTTALGFHFSLG